jgi:FtsP/CotA-like multicopper oxidase with cupredoxin domain
MKTQPFVFFGTLLAVTACGDKADKAPAKLDSGSEAGPLIDAFEDINPDPNIFEAHLTARETTLSLGGESIRMLSYGGGVPGPEIRVVQGDKIIIHLQNELPDGFPTTIHWHGIEGSNAMDGTPVTQTPVAVGDSFTYEFIAPRPGVYWYHPHIRGGQTTFSGLYAPLIVEDPDEGKLVEMGILPADRQTLVLSDVSTYGGEVISVEIDNAMEIMNGTEGELLMVNGQLNPTIEVGKGDGVRLQLLNSSITRFYRLRVPGHKLIRIGGEGGLLDKARHEGGSVRATIKNLDGDLIGERTVSLRHDTGEIVLGPAERADVVLIPKGDVGETIQLRWEDYARGRHGMWMEGDEMVMGDADDDGTRPGIQIATFEIVPGTGSSYSLSAGDPILEAVGRSVGQIDTSGTTVDFTGVDQSTKLQGAMPMWKEGDTWLMDTEMSIDGVEWHPEMMMGPTQPEAPTAKHAALGDVLIWEVHNTTSMAHPWHLHGFSYQPLEFIRHDSEHDEHKRKGVDAAADTGSPWIDEETTTHWTIDYDEYEDTTLIPPHTSLIYRVKLEDVNGDGGAAGRWLKHCHIFQHGADGMMSELIVSP